HPAPGWNPVRDRVGVDDVRLPAARGHCGPGLRPGCLTIRHGPSPVPPERHGAGDGPWLAVRPAKGDSPGTLTFQGCPVKKDSEIPMTAAIMARPAARTTVAATNPKYTHRQLGDVLARMVRESNAPIPAERPGRRTLQELLPGHERHPGFV